MNKNLMAIFRKDGEFKQSDVVELDEKHMPHGGLTNVDKLLLIEITPDNKYNITPDNKYNITVEKLKYETYYNVEISKLITPFVSLWEVLEKIEETNLNRKEDDKWHYSTYLFKEYFAINAKTYNENGNTDKLISVKWILSDKSGKVPLHRQSQTTQDQIYEVLK